MKRYTTSRVKGNKERVKQWHNEHKSGGFKCSHCKQFVVINGIMGTANRNHCNMCLWSKHVDEAKGDRRATCQSGMQPIGLTLKHEGPNKIGEIMIIHLCSGCPKISINRVARDDPEYRLIEVFSSSLELSETIRADLLQRSITLLAQPDRHEISIQLFGK